MHGDASLLNIIVWDQTVTLINWDFPAVKYPLAELSALDEHVYLSGADRLPAAFLAGYGRDVPADLLLAYRTVGCLGWLSGDDWTRWNAMALMPAPARRRLELSDRRLLDWVDRMPDLHRDFAI